MAEGECVTEQDGVGADDVGDGDAVGDALEGEADTVAVADSEGVGVLREAEADGLNEADVGDVDGVADADTVGDPVGVAVGVGDCVGAGVGVEDGCPEGDDDTAGSGVAPVVNPRAPPQACLAWSSAVWACWTSAPESCAVATALWAAATIEAQSASAEAVGVTARPGELTAMAMPSPASGSASHERRGRRRTPSRYPERGVP